jgi:hypothetical protein
VASALGLVLLFGCGGGDKPPVETAPGSVKEAAEDAQMVLTGILEPTVEGRGWILKTEGKTLLLLDIEDHREKDWFRVGAKVIVTGKESPDTVTIYMQGTPFRVSKMEPAA